MKTTHLSALLIAAIAAFLLVPTTADAGHGYCTPSPRLVGYHTCGAPIYMVPVLCGYDACGNPRYSWRREIRHNSCRCRRPSYSHSHYRSGSSCSSGGFRISFGW